MRRVLVIILLLLTAAVGIGLAADGDSGTATAGRVSQCYDPDHRKAAFMVNALGGTYATSVSTLTSTTTGRFALNGRQTVAVSARFSASTQTCKVRLLYSFVDTSTSTEYPFELSPERTITSNAFTDAAGRYMSDVQLLDGAGATHVRPIITGAVSSGTGDLWVGSR